jgi:HK97 gp10 family phage protein
MPSVRMKIEGVEELLRKLATLASEKTATKLQRQAATAAIRPMRSAAKSECPVDEGGLKKSIDSKVSNRGLKVTAIVGSNTAVMEDGRKSTGKDEGPRAARHLHLVINGHITPEGEAIPGNNFLGRAYDATAAQAEKIYSDKLAEGYDAAAGAK